MLIICHNIILKSYPNIYHLILLCDFVIINFDKVLKLEGWLLYFLAPYQSLFELYSQGFSFNLWITHNTTLLFGLDFYDGLHMSSLLLHVKVEVDIMGYGICSSRSMSPIPEGWNYYTVRLICYCSWSFVYEGLLQIIFTYSWWSHFIHWFNLLMWDYSL